MLLCPWLWVAQCIVFMYRRIRLGRVPGSEVTEQRCGTTPPRTLMKVLVDLKEVGHLAVRLSMLWFYRKLSRVLPLLVRSALSLRSLEVVVYPTSRVPPIPATLQ